MKIRLTDLSKEGIACNFKKGQEVDLDEALKDLLGSQNYQVDFILKPLDQLGTFDLKGTFLTQWEEYCSRCSEPFLFPFHTHFHQILIPYQELSRTETSFKPHHMELHFDLDHLNESYEYFDGQFDLGEFLHEMITLARPMAPAPEKNAENKCLHCGLSVDQIGLKTEASPEGRSFSHNNPFNILKNIKN